MPICKHCGAIIQFFESHCENCSEFDGYPNVRMAREEVKQLAARYHRARAAAFARDTNVQLDAVEHLAEGAKAVVNMPVRAADNIMRGDKYRNYYQSLSAGMRTVAEMKHHAERGKVDATFFPQYYPHIISMVLSPNGRGLISYGPVMMTIDNNTYLHLRASLLIRNVYKFYDEHDLGARKATAPLGYRSDWSGRSILAVTKLEPSINTSSTASDIQEAFLKVTNDRETDEFVEVHVFAQGGIPRDRFASVTLQKALTDDDDQDRWRLIQRNGTNLGISVVG